MSSVYRDVLWGDIPIREPVLRELVQSAPVQRLRGIHQAGAGFYMLPSARPTTRFEHSLGVLYVLASMGAGHEERVAGLLHDVPHTAFSHTADIVFPNDEHNFHERFQHSVIMASQVPSILERHGVPLKAALEPDSYPLLEQPLPDLCADRLDYALRDMHATGHITADEARQFLSHLVPTPAGPVVDDTEAALWFALLFRKANDLLWTGPLEAGAYWALAGAIRRAYSIEAFSDADLFSTDDAAMRKLRSSADPEVQAYLSLLRPGINFYAVEDDGPSFKTHMKQRHVDPPVWEPHMARPLRLSALSDGYRQTMASFPPGGSVHYRLWSSSMPPLLRASASPGQAQRGSSQAGVER